MSERRLDLYHDDCLIVLETIPSNSIDAVVTDPPAGITFMGKAWDDFGGRHGFVEFMTKVMRECLRVLKPGGHALVWALPRTAHWTGWAVEDAGFEIRDVVLHLFGQGFPKSHDVSKAIDRHFGAERKVIAANPNHRPISGVAYEGVYSGANTGAPDITAPAIDDAKNWEGWGTALKPAAEHWIMARKPFEGTVAANVLMHRTGALNVDGCRVKMQPDDPSIARQSWSGDRGFAGTRGVDQIGSTNIRSGGGSRRAGRFPANVTLDEEAAAALDAQSGVLKSGRLSPVVRANRGGYSGPFPEISTYSCEASSGGASRFFYVAKAPKKDRTAGGEVENKHPTVKNTELMRWLCRLITPPGGVVLDPFMGSGSTGIAAWREGFGFVGIEAELASYDTAFRRFELLLWEGEDVDS